MKKAEKKDQKKVAVWLDHHVAHVTTLKKDKVVIRSILSGIEANVRVKGEGATGTRVGKNRSSNNEDKIHNKKADHLAKYYKDLIKTIAKSDFIYLFGPATAKNELLNKFRESGKMNAKIVIMDSAEEMTINQMVARVKAVLG